MCAGQLVALRLAFTVEMACVSPQSSVSQQCGESAVDVVLPAPVIDESVFRGCSFEQRKELVVALYAEYYKACVSCVVSGSVRSVAASSVTTVSDVGSAISGDSGVSSVSVGSSSVSRPSARARRRRRKKDGLMVSPTDAPAETYTDGLCYLRLVHPGYRTEVQSECGMWPTMRVVLGLPLSRLISVAEMSSFMVVVSDGGLHFVDSCDGYPLPQVVAQIAFRYRTALGTLGSAWTPSSTGLNVHQDMVVGGYIGAGMMDLPTEVISDCVGLRLLLRVDVPLDPVQVTFYELLAMPWYHFNFQRLTTLFVAMSSTESCALTMSPEFGCRLVDVLTHFSSSGADVGTLSRVLATGGFSEGKSVAPAMYAHMLLHSRRDLFLEDVRVLGDFRDRGLIALIRHSHRVSVSRIIGDELTVERLLSLPQEWINVAGVFELRSELMVDGRCAVGYGRVGIPLRRLLVPFCGRSIPGTFGSKVGTVSLGGRDGLSLDTRIVAKLDVDQ